MKRYIIFVIAFAMIMPSLKVYSADEIPMGLNDAINISLDNNNRYKIAHEKVQEKDYKVKQVWGDLWPELSSGVSQTVWDAEKGALSGSKGQTSVQLLKGTLLVNPGAFYGKLSSSREERILSINEERKIKSDTIVSSIQLYYNVLLSEEMVKLHNDSVKALDENLRIIEALYHEGTLTRLVYLRAQVSAVNEKTILINARKNFESAIARFNIQLGRDIDFAVHLNENSLLLENPGDIEILTIMSKDRLKHYNEFVTLAIKNRPEIIMIQHKKALYQSNLAESNSVYLWPAFFVGANYGITKLKDPVTNITTGYPDPTLDLALNSTNKNLNPEGWNRTWDFTVGATYKWGALSPVDASGSRGSQFKSLSAQTDMEMEDFVRNVKLEIQEGLLTLDAASSSYLSQKENVKSAEESLRVAAVQFKNGLIDNTILLNANVELSSAKAMYVQSLFDFQVAKAKLNQSMGQDYFQF